MVVVEESRPTLLALVRPWVFSIGTFGKTPKSPLSLRISAFLSHPLTGQQRGNFKPSMEYHEIYAPEPLGIITVIMKEKYKIRNC